MSRFLREIGLGVAVVLWTAAPAFAPPFYKPPPRPTFETFRPPPIERSPHMEMPPPGGHQAPGSNRLIETFPEIFGERSPAKAPLEKFATEVAKDRPDSAVLAQTVKEILERDNSDLSRIAISRALRQAKGGFKEVSASKAWPRLTLQRPTSPAFDAAVKVLKDYVDIKLNRTVDRDGLILLPLTFSSDAAAKLKELPPAKLARKGWMKKLADGDFKQLDYQMFASLRGKTLVVIGHVVNPGKEAAFEIRRPDGQRAYLPLLALLAAAKKHKFNFIPYGCETNETMALGTATKINDLDALNAYQNAIKKSGTTPYGELLSDLSSETAHLSIDLRLLDDQSSIPVDIVDREGKKVVPRAITPFNAVGQSSAPFAQLQINASTDPVAMTEEESTEALARSLWIEEKAKTIEFAWMCIFVLLAILTVTLHVTNVSSVDIIIGEASAGLAVALLIVGTVASYFVASILESWLSQPIFLPWLLSIFVISIGAFFLSVRLDGEPIVRYTTQAIAAWTIIPAGINLLLTVLHSLGALVATDRILLVSYPVMSSC